MYATPPRCRRRRSSKYGPGEAARAPRGRVDLAGSGVHLWRARAGRDWEATRARETGPMGDRGPRGRAQPARDAGTGAGGGNSGSTLRVDFRRTGRGPGRRSFNTWCVLCKNGAIVFQYIHSQFTRIDRDVSPTLCHTAPKDQREPPCPRARRHRLRSSRRR